VIHQSWVFNKYLSSDAVDSIVTRCNKLDKQVAQVGDTRGYREDKKSRIADIAFLDRYIDQDLYALIYNLGIDANNKAFGFSLNELETIQFTEYNGHKKAKYDWHTDLDWFDKGMSQRKLSVVVQLSDPKDYKGGEFEIANSKNDKQMKSDMKQKGSVIVFPAFFEHRVKPVTEGKRLSLIGWVHGTKFR
tara:strand:- start:429 stop:998 length:570 start_codon:yes stop_codon:yes gene_type:complete